MGQYSMQAQKLPAAISDRKNWIWKELGCSTKRLVGYLTRQRATDLIVHMLGSCHKGKEHEHLHAMLQYVDFKGTDVLLDCGLEVETRQEAPYPAFGDGPQCMLTNSLKNNTSTLLSL